MGTTRCLLIDTTTGERHALTVLTRSLHDLLARQIAAGIARESPDSRPDRPPADTTG